MSSIKAEIDRYHHESAAKDALQDTFNQLTASLIGYICLYIAIFLVLEVALERTVGMAK
jgi:hypothetical protein